MYECIIFSSEMCMSIISFCHHATAAVFPTSGAGRRGTCSPPPQTGAVLRELAGHHGGVLALLRAGGRLWSASEDGTLRVWDVEVCPLPTASVWRSPPRREADLRSGKVTEPGGQGVA